MKRTAITLLIATWAACLWLAFAPASDEPPRFTQARDEPGFTQASDAPIAPPPRISYRSDGRIQQDMRYWTPTLVFHPPGEPVTPEQQCAMDRDLDAMAKRYGTSYPLDLLGKTCPGGHL